MYAKWQDVRCEGEADWYDEISHCATRDVDNVVYYWTDENSKSVISIKNPNGDEIITMLDRNL
jgi:hypothetical protein